jgi:hypothetical protein
MANARPPWLDQTPARFAFSPWPAPVLLSSRQDGPDLLPAQPAESKKEPEWQGLSLQEREPRLWQEN